jgi:predicted amidohydrolase
MKLALAQMQLEASLEANLKKSLEAIEQASIQGAQLVCFPEIHLSPFFPQYPARDVSPYVVKTGSEAIRKLCTQCGKFKIAAVPNLYLEEGANRYDASLAIDADGSILGISKMVHIVQVPRFYEQDYYTPSNTGFQVYTTRAGKIGIVICFDRHYPESIRACALKGADLIIIPTANTKDEPLEVFEWELRVPARQNGLFIAMCNRVGLEGEMDFAGESIVVDPNGDVVMKANDQEQIIYADIDLALIAKTRNSRPYLKLRRPEKY